MATTDEDLKQTFKMFGDEVKALVLDIYTTTNMEDEHFATVVSQGIVGAMDSSVRALQVYKANEATDTTIAINKEKLEQERRTTPFRLDMMRIQNNTLEQKYFTEQLRNGGVSFTYTFYRSYIDDVGNKVETQLINEDTITVDVEQTIQNEDGTQTTQTVQKDYILFRDYKRVASKVINAGTGLSTVELANLKLAAETDYIENQSGQLSASVIYNNKIKAMDSLADLFGTLGAGGLVVPDTGWGAIFSIANELTGSSLLDTGFQSAVTKVS